MGEYFIEIWNDDVKELEHYNDAEVVINRIAELSKKATHYCLYVAECIVDNT